MNPIVMLRPGVVGLSRSIKRLLPRSRTAQTEEWKMRHESAKLKGGVAGCAMKRSTLKCRSTTIAVRASTV